MVNAAEIRDLHKYYDLGEVVVKALRGVTAEFPKGDFVGSWVPREVARVRC